MMNRILITLFSTLLISSLTLSAQVADGIASFYGDGFHGRSTSTGETFNKHAMTAACQVFPNGSVLKVTNKANGRSVQVKVNDCGPHVAGRIIDLSSGAAQVIGLRLGEVRVEVITLGTDGPTCNRGRWIRAGRPPFRLNLSAFPVTGAPPSSTRPPTAPSAPTPDNGRVLGNPNTQSPTAANNGRVLTNSNIPPPTAPTAPTATTPRSPARTPVRAATMPPPVAPTTPTVRLSSPPSRTANPTTAPASTAAPTTYSPPIRIEQPQEIETAPAPSTPPPSRPSPAPNGEVAAQYAVQIAAYREQSNANSMIEELRAAGFEGAIAIRGGSIIRVFSKPVNFREQADYWKEKLAEAGFNGSIRRIR